MQIHMILLRLYDSDCFVKLRKSVIVMLEVIDLLLMSPAASNDAVSTASCLCVYMYACMCVYVCMCMHVCMYVCIYVCTYTHI